MHLKCRRPWWPWRSRAGPGSFPGQRWVAAPAPRRRGSGGGDEGIVRKEKSGVKRSLVVVESPTKVKTIQKYLDPKYVVKASMGHVRDLPKSQLGRGSQEGLQAPLRDLAQQEEGPRRAEEGGGEVRRPLRGHRPRPGRGGHRLAPGPGASRSTSGTCYRITFNEITERAVKAAFLHPGKIDLKKVDAQQARRVLDRLVGYNLSPLLWDKVQRGLSAGRVQSVAVRPHRRPRARDRGLPPRGVLVAPRAPAGRAAARVRRHPPGGGRREGVAARRGDHARRDGAPGGRALRGPRGDARRAPALPGAPVHHLDPPAGGRPQARLHGRRRR